MDFRSVSLPSRGAFHLSLSVLCAIGHVWYLVLDHGRPCFKRDFSCPALLRISSQRDWVFVYKAFTFCGSLFQHDSANSIFCNSAEAQQCFLDGPATPFQQRLLPYTGMVWTGPCSLTTTWGISSISFPPGTEMFHFSGLLTFRCHGSAPVGLPHSDIRGSRPACGSPRRFAACCVFHRPYVPRHPSIALDTLTCFSFVLFGCQGAFHVLRLVGFCVVGSPDKG